LPTGKAKIDAFMFSSSFFISIIASFKDTLPFKTSKSPSSFSNFVISVKCPFFFLKSVSIVITFFPYLGKDKGKI
jgi:hypothetical protein